MRTAALRYVWAVASFLIFHVTHAADQVVAVPSGWSPNPYRFAASAQKTAVILYPNDVDPFTATSKIMLVSSNGASTLATLSGKAYAMSASTNGAYFVVHHNGVEGMKVSLLSASTGSVVWTKSNDPRQFTFSASGAFIIAHRPHAEAPAGSDIEIFDLQGVSRRRVTFGTPVTAVIAPDDASRIVVVQGRTITAFSFAQTPMVQLWSRDLASSEPELYALRIMGPDRFVALQELGSFKVMKWDGTVEYTFNPEALDAADPARTFSDYASFEPYPTPLANKLLLYRNSSDALIVNLATGALSGKVIDIATPAGFSLLNQIDSGRLLLESGAQVRIRSIAFQ